LRTLIELVVAPRRSISYLLKTISKDMWAYFYTQLCKWGCYFRLSSLSFFSSSSSPSLLV